MAALVEILLILLPVAGFLAWRRFGPATGEPSAGTLAALAIGVALALAAAAWYGLSRSHDRSTTYVPAVMGPDGRIQPGHVEPRP